MKYVALVLMVAVSLIAMIDLAHGRWIDALLDAALVWMLWLMTR